MGSSPIRLKQQNEKRQTAEQQTFEQQTKTEEETDDEDLIVYLTIEDTQYEEIEVKISDSFKTVREQVKSIIRVFELPEKDKKGTPLIYHLGLVEGTETEFLQFEDEDGHELCILDYNIQPGDHLHLVAVPISETKKRWFLPLVIFFITVTPAVGMLMFDQSILFDKTGIQLSLTFSIACVLGLLYLERISTIVTNRQWTMVRCIVTIAYIINLLLLFGGIGHQSGPYIILSFGLSVLTAFTFLVSTSKE